MRRARPAVARETCLVYYRQALRDRGPITFFNLSRFGETIHLLGARIELSISYFLLRDFELCPQRIGHPVRQIRQAYE